MRDESVSAMFMDIAEIKDMMQSMQSALTNNEIDWEARRYEIAKSAMQGMLSDANNHATYTTDVARKAVNFANALICELQKKEDYYEDNY